MNICKKKRTKKAIIPSNWSKNLSKLIVENFTPNIVIAYFQLIKSKFLINKNLALKEIY